MVVPEVGVSFVTALEQLAPNDAIDLAELADAAAFAGVTATDRFQPWTPSQGNASFIWNVLSAASQRTRGSLTAIAVPGFRMHPAQVAQASATLAAIAPGRHTLVLAAGNAIDEHITGSYWPEAAERIDRLFDAAEIVRKLFYSAARDVRHSGPYYRMETARLWTTAPEPPPLLIWVAGPVTARRAGKMADGFATGGAAPERLAPLLQRFDEGAKEAGRDPSAAKKVLHLHLSWAPTDEQAVQAVVREWPTALLPLPYGDVRSPWDIDRLSRSVRSEDPSTQLLASADPDKHRAHLQRLLDVGFTHLALHNVAADTRNQREWIEVFSREVLPALRR